LIKLFAGFRKHLRLLVRLTCLLGAILCLGPIFQQDFLLPLIPALSPFVSVGSLLSARAFHLYIGLGLAIGFITLLRRRWFCRWVCPMGLCLDGASSLGRRCKRKSCLGISLGRWLVGLTLGGAILGSPLFLWLDPLALFSGVFLLTKYSQDLTGWISALVFLGILLASFFWPNLWCSGLCPLGAFQDLLSQMFRYARSVFLPKTEKPATANASHPVLRRTVLGMALGAGCVGVARRIGDAAARPLRPPGAVTEQTFAGLCLRCGNCIRSCPHGIIQRDPGGNGWTNILTPRLRFEHNYCREDCVRGTEVCPSGALARVPLDIKKRIKSGLPRVNMDVCLLGREKECSACRRWCPYGAIHYVFSEAEYTLIPVIDPETCNGCGACEMACPTKPEKAIQVFSIL